MIYLRLTRQFVYWQ